MAQARAKPIDVIVAALREHRPALSLPTARLEAETILLRLQEAGALPPVPVGWPKEGEPGPR